MISLACLLSLALVPHQFPVLGRGIPMASSGGDGGSLITAADLTCARIFQTPVATTGPSSPDMPVTMRLVGGVRHYFQYQGNNHVVEFTEPAGSTCTTAPGSASQASVLKDWGAFPTVHTATNPDGGENTPMTGSEGSQAQGLYWDETTSQLVMLYTGTYSNVPAGQNTFALATFGASTLSLVGCYAVGTGYHGPMVGSGMTEIPSSFVGAHLSTNQRWGIGVGGGFATFGAGPSLGPTLTAIVPPSGNACASATNNNLTGAITDLVQYPTNGTSGPSCVSVGGSNLGCNTSGLTPSTPYPATMAWAQYSYDMYQQYWDPYPTGASPHGWFTGILNPTAWYHTTIKDSVVSAFEMADGYTQTTVSASPAPTMSYPNGTMTVGSVDAHDGTNWQANDLIWVTTCTVGVDAGCASGNGEDKSFAVVDTVVGSAVTFHITSPDGSTGSHTPVVGGQVQLGGVYAHGSPTFSRGVPRLQVYDPAQYVSVIAGSIQPYQVAYHEEIALTSLFTGWGLHWPNPGGWGYGDHAAVSVIPDPTNKVLVLFFKGASGTSLLGVVINVSDTP